MMREGETTMERATFTLTARLSRQGASDLASMLVGMSGVGAVRMEPAGQAVEVEFDPDYTRAAVVARRITSAGYPHRGYE
jgi:hypothetical protein